jgi:hypothetical protein
LSLAMYYYSTAARSNAIPHNDKGRTGAVAIVWEAEEGRDGANGRRGWQRRWWSRRLTLDASAGEEGGAEEGKHMLQKNAFIVAMV